ncbi:hypothetical protein K435DRAFT_871786, partial [Dendrothele bispora CBS 962.96]
RATRGTPHDHAIFRAQEGRLNLAAPRGLLTDSSPPEPQLSHIEEVTRDLSALTRRGRRDIRRSDDPAIRPGAAPPAAAHRFALTNVHQSTLSRTLPGPGPIAQSSIQAHSTPIEAPNFHGITVQSDGRDQLLTSVSTTTDMLFTDHVWRTHRATPSEEHHIQRDDFDFRTYQLPPRDAQPEQDPTLLPDLTRTVFSPTMNGSTPYIRSNTMDPSSRLVPAPGPYRRGSIPNMHRERLTTTGPMPRLALSHQSLVGRQTHSVAVAPRRGALAASQKQAYSRLNLEEPDESELEESDSHNYPNYPNYPESEYAVRTSPHCDASDEEEEEHAVAHTNAYLNTRIDPSDPEFAQLPEWANRGMPGEYAPHRVRCHAHVANLAGSRFLRTPSSEPPPSPEPQLSHIEEVTRDLSALTRRGRRDISPPDGPAICPGAPPPAIRPGAPPPAAAYHFALTNVHQSTSSRTLPGPGPIAQSSIQAYSTPIKAPNFHGITVQSDGRDQLLTSVSTTADRDGNGYAF